MFYPEEKTSRYVDVLLPLAVPTTYTYALPRGIKPSIGQRVVVSLGKKKLYSGVIVAIHTNHPGHEVKPILEVSDDPAPVYPIQIEFWRWIADYYMCHLGEVMHAAMPAGLKLQSESKILLSREVPKDLSSLKVAEYALLESLENHPWLTVADCAKILEVVNPMPTIKRLLEAGFILMEEELNEETSPQTHRLLFTAKNFNDAEWKEIFSQLKRAPKQLRVLEAFLLLKEDLHEDKVPEQQVIKKAQASKPLVDALIEKNILSREEVLGDFEPDTSPANLELSKSQKTARKHILDGFNAQKPVLLHGVTSSGKTEIYISLIKEALQNHTRALYLVPEIALTTQLISRLKNHFGQQAFIYHSRLSERERLAVYKQLLTTPGPVVLLGARSALLLPLHDLGLIVIDEEHDPSFKQQNPAPRYHARDSALVLARLHKCAVLLGSATPAIESYHNALEQKYHLVELHERFGGVMMPEIEVHDLRKAGFNKTLKGHFSEKLLNEIEETIKKGKKAILFQNRRGYTPVIQCTDCGHAQKCINCDITLTYHKNSHYQKCHYCGYQSRPLPACPDCGSTSLKEVGFGTEKIEEELETLVPAASVARMDLDSTRRKNAFAQLIQRFAFGDLNVLVGTQMVTKGLDFEDVQLVAIMNADSLLHYPDFRAQERAYQLMEQVAGRAGRRNKRGRVVIQTYRPGHHIIEFVLNHQYKNMVAQQLEERKVFNYPPYCRLIHISLRHKDVVILNQAAENFANLLRPTLQNRMLGPEFPPVSRLRNVYHKDIIIKMERELSVSSVKDLLRAAEKQLYTYPPYRSVRVVFDVDPY